MAEEAKWYVAHTYSGYENTVKATIEAAMSMIAGTARSMGVVVGE